MILKESPDNPIAHNENRRICRFFTGILWKVRKRIPGRFWLTNCHFAGSARGQWRDFGWSVDRHHRVGGPVRSRLLNCHLWGCPHGQRRDCYLVNFPAKVTPLAVGLADRQTGICQTMQAWRESKKSFICFAARFCATFPLCAGTYEERFLWN